jgi:hypothetical protein
MDGIERRRATIHDAEAFQEIDNPWQNNPAHSGIMNTTLQLETILRLEKNAHLLENFVRAGFTDSDLGKLTDADLLQIGVPKIGDRRRLLAALAERAHACEAIEPPPQMPTATAECPHFSRIGLPFVPIPGFKSLACIWPLRVCDYRLYCEDRGIPFPDQQNPTGDTHPVVNVSWRDGIEFCLWLTLEERAAGLMAEDQFFRLLTDLEWSAALGLPNEPESNPAARSKKIPGYPWGPSYPPPAGFGNFDQSLNVDSHAFTSPVDAFPPNELGMYDLSGNVWEWCMDNYNTSLKYHTMRGGSWDIVGTALMSSARNANSPDGTGASMGLRIAWSRQDFTS